MKKFVLVLTLIILTACSESAALSQLTAPHFPAGWTTYTNANEYIQDLAFDRVGNMWAASLGGLVRWNVSDGTYTKFTTDDGLPSNAITAVLPARDGTLWVATREGITSFDGKNWTNYPQPEQHSLVKNIYQDSRGLIWFTTEGEGVLTFDGNRWMNYSIDSGLGSNAVDAVSEDREGNIWLGTWFILCGCEGSPKYVEGVSRYDGYNWTVIGTDLGLENWGSGIQVTSIAVNTEGGLWFGTTFSGTVYYDGANHKIFTTADGLPDNTINDIKVGQDGTVWFATQSGLARYDGREWHSFTVKEGLADNQVLSLAIAPDQTIWAGTANGISSFDGRTWHSLKTDEMLPSNQVNGIDSTPKGIVWLATEQGAAAFDGRSWKLFTTDNGIPGAGIASAVAVAPDGTTWIGTKAVSSPPDSGAIVHINRDDQISYSTLETLRNRGISEVMEGVYAIDVDASGDVWVGSYDTWHFDGAHWTAPPSSNCNRSERLVISPTLGIWIGSWGGVCQFFNQAWTRYGPGYENQVGFDVRGLAVAPDNAVWVATELSDETFHTQTAFKRFDGKDWTVKATMNLRDVTDMDFAADGTLWVATRDGAYKYDGTWTHYTVQDGLAGNEVLHIHVADDGSVWFATNDGLTRFENLSPK